MTRVLCTFGSPLADIELWRCAQQQLDQHGTLSAIVAANDRIENLTVAGDTDGVNTWMAIALRILQLAFMASPTTLH